MVLAPPDSLLIDCPIDKPPSSLDKPALVNAWNSQTINLGNCNVKLGELREWKTKTSKVNSGQ